MMILHFYTHKHVYAIYTNSDLSTDSSLFILLPSSQSRSSQGSCMIWEALRVVNEHISRLFQLLAQQAAVHPEAYSEAVGLLAIKPPSKWEVQPGTYAGALSTEAAMCQLRAAFVEVGQALD